VKNAEQVVQESIHSYFSKLDFLTQQDIDEENKLYQDQLAEIAKWREKNIPVVLEWKEKESPKIAYVYKTLEEIHPIYSESDGYGTIHVWITNDSYVVGIEMERRYLSIDEQHLPQVRVYNDDISNRILKTIKKLKDL
jgi:hypothetical protein